MFFYFFLLFLYISVLLNFIKILLTVLNFEFLTRLLDFYVGRDRNKDFIIFTMLLNTVLITQFLISFTLFTLLFM